MLHTYTGPSRLSAFWQDVTAQRGRILSPAAASTVLRCSFEHIHRLAEGGELEAWSYRPAEDEPPGHFMISITSLVRHGIRAGRFYSAQHRDLDTLGVSDEEFATLRAEALGDGAD